MSTARPFSVACVCCHTAIATTAANDVAEVAPFEAGRMAGFRVQQTQRLTGYVFSQPLISQRW